MDKEDILMWMPICDVLDNEKESEQVKQEDSSIN